MTINSRPASPDAETFPLDAAPAAGPASAQEGIPEALAGAFMDGEEVKATLPGEDGGRFLLSTRRVMHLDGGEAGGRWSTALLDDIRSVEISTVPRGRSGLVWSILGFIAAIGIWQVSTHPTIALVGGVGVALIATALLVDHVFRHPGSRLLFMAGSGQVGGPVDGKAVNDATVFATRYFELREQQRRAAAGTPRYPRFPSA